MPTTELSRRTFLGMTAALPFAVSNALKGAKNVPVGLELYSEQEDTGVPLAAVPEDRREVAVDHNLRSEDDARSLAADLVIFAGALAKGLRTADLKSDGQKVIGTRPMGDAILGELDRLAG